MATGAIRKHVRAGGVRYEVVHERGVDPVTGKRKQESKTFKTRKEAEAYLRARQGDLDNHTAVDVSKMTVAAYLRDWLALAKRGVAPTTYQSYESVARVHLIPALGSLPLQKLTPLHIKRCETGMATAPRQDGKKGTLSDTTIRYAHAVLRLALKEAVRMRLIPHDPSANVKPPRMTRPVIEYWDEAQAQQFLQAAEHDGYAPIWRVALSTGCRKGELLGLRWKDVDLDKGLVHVRQNVTVTRENGLRAGPTKNRQHRSMTVDPVCLAVLRAHRAARPLPIDGGQRDNAPVFPSSTGTIIDPRNLTHRFEALVQRSGVKAISFHGMRHTHATLLLLQGVDVKTVSTRLGHASIQITLDTYAHVLPQMDQRAAEAIGRALAGGG